MVYYKSRWILVIRDIYQPKQMEKKSEIEH